jgi:hypothetical protein
MSFVNYLGDCHPCRRHLVGVLGRYQEQREQVLPLSWLLLQMIVDFFFP